MLRIRQWQQWCRAAQLPYVMHPRCPSLHPSVTRAMQCPTTTKGHLAHTRESITEARLTLWTTTYPEDYFQQHHFDHRPLMLLDHVDRIPVDALPHPLLHGLAQQVGPQVSFLYFSLPKYTATLTAWIQQVQIVHCRTGLRLFYRTHTGERHYITQLPWCRTWMQQKRSLIEFTKRAHHAWQKYTNAMSFPLTPIHNVLPVDATGHHTANESVEPPETHRLESDTAPADWIVLESQLGNDSPDSPDTTATGRQSMVMLGDTV
jgi:hypothetical protein